ncbi:histidine kinase [Undibacterium sp. Jales W-56]|uniref:sensor histidine kinase n=1 Tax=Undibacterium sp. Jales W-56 TaxID=2897325 RepID=UPI0021CE6AC1|nr:histidine kinase [Undibacterium sp. Jales W-56]MCU6434382.1 histidine kinase [Undibacterium sp. Jales W-56]
MTSNMRKLMWYLMAWLLAGVVIAALLVTTAGTSWQAGLGFAIPVSLIYGFVAASAYYVCRSLPMAKRQFFLTLAIFGGASLISGLMWLALCYAWNYLAYTLRQLIGFGAVGGTVGGTTLPGSLIAITPQMSVMLFAAGSCLYLLSIFAHDVLIAFENVRLADRRAAESRVQARDAELQVLRTQINPHFLFNSLNSISALTSIDPAAARSMTLELAQFFRQTLASSEKERIPLAEEIRLCEHFLAIEKIRFGHKLQSDIQIADTAQTALLPPMLLQPCIENAIKHGIRDLTEGGTIVVRALSRGDWLHITIQNPIDPAPGDTVGNGHGLKNSRLRLQSMYGDKARISWTRSSDTFLVEIAIPQDSAI